MTDRRAHLTDRALYRDFYEKDQQPGIVLPMERGEPRLLFALEHLGPDDDVLDVGCHKGEMTIALWARTRGAVVGVDISHNALDHARRLAAAARFDIAYAQGDAAALPFPDASFDLVVLAEVLEHVPDVDAVVAEAERVLRPGGAVVVSVPRDALAADAVDAVDRDRITGHALDMHVREFVPADAFAGRPGLQLAEGAVRGPDDAVVARFRMASYTVGES